MPCSSWQAVAHLNSCNDFRVQAFSPVQGKCKTWSKSLVINQCAGKNIFSEDWQMIRVISNSMHVLNPLLEKGYMKWQ